MTGILYLFFLYRNEFSNTRFILFLLSRLRMKDTCICYAHTRICVCVYHRICVQICMHVCVCKPIRIFKDNNLKVRKRTDHLFKFKLFKPRYFGTCFTNLLKDWITFIHSLIYYTEKTTSVSFERVA